MATVIVGIVLCAYIVVLVLCVISKSKYIRIWGFGLVIFLPYIGMLLAALARKYTGCSEYKQFRSEYCEEKSRELGVNLEEVIFLSEITSYLLFTYIAMPALLFLLAYKSRLKRAKNV